MTYIVKFAKQALKDIARLEISEPKVYIKALKIIAELREHPLFGTGKPEQLKGDRSGQWSRRLSKKHRIIYEIHDNEIVVLILSAFGHYSDH